MGVLTTSAKASPFSYAAAATAAFTNKADLVFEDEAVTTSLDLDGKKNEGDEAIVLALAKAGGLSEDSSKVDLHSFAYGSTLT
jgi:glutamyl-tRNA synthetase